MSRSALPRPIIARLYTAVQPVSTRVLLTRSSYLLPIHAMVVALMLYILVSVHRDLIRYRSRRELHSSFAIHRVPVIDRLERVFDNFEK